MKKKKPRFPLFMDISDKNITVVGGGKIAGRRIKKLLPFCTRLTVISPDLEDDLFSLYKDSFGNRELCRIIWKNKEFEDYDIEDSDIVLACSDDSALNRDIALLCRRRNILVNVCDDREQCDFHFPSLVLTEKATIGISSGGEDISAVKKIRQEIEAMNSFRKKIIVGSRESILAVIQSNLLIDHLKTFHPEIHPELITFKTTGDKITDRRLDEIGGKGLFVKELDQALADGRIDISVHSLKDVPAMIPEELPLVAFSVREDPRDVLILPEGVSQIDFSKPIGTSSGRRICQAKKIFPEASFRSVRGNIQTRLKKLDAGECSALILAAAGIRRLGLENRISRYFSVDEMIPSAGQGIIAVQGRAGEDHNYLSSFNDTDSCIAAKAERVFIRAIGAGCTSPVAVYADVHKNHVVIRCFYYNEQTGSEIRLKAEGDASDAAKLAVALAAKIGVIHE